MERPTGLADLKLVNKYYPVANYSYPSPKIEGQAASSASSSAAAAAAAAVAERMGDRSSVDSQSSVPGMVDDRESVISTDEGRHVGNDRDQYHISGAELWDSFWEDPFWEANAEEASHETDSITRKIIHRNTSYPALIPSPDSSCRKDHYFGDGGRRHGASSSAPSASCAPTTTWPLIASEVPVAPRPLTPKANYSLFPRAATSTVPVNLSPSRPPTLSANAWASSSSSSWSSSWETPRRKAGSTVSLTSLNRASKPKKLLLVGAHAAERTSWAQSAPVTPVLAGPTPPSSASSSASSSSSSASYLLVSSSSLSSATDSLAERRGSIISLQQKPRIPINLPRTRSETLVSRSSVRSTTYSIRANKSQLDLPLSTPPAIPPRPRSPELPPPATQCNTNRYSQFEMPVKIHTQIPLHRCRTETNLLTLRQRRSQASIRTVATSCTITPMSSTSSSSSSSAAAAAAAAAAAIAPAPTPEPVSVFEVDSDSEVEEESLARRIARTFRNNTSTSSGNKRRTRSASAAPRSRKGNEVFRGQLSRARAETLEGGNGGGSSSLMAVAMGTTTEEKGETKGSSSGGGGRSSSRMSSGGGGQPAPLRRQKSEVFGKMLWGRR